MFWLQVLPCSFVRQNLLNAKSIIPGASGGIGLETVRLFLGLLSQA
jgi:hypothetical protein